jgi:hypothetical protein
MLVLYQTSIKKQFGDLNWTNNHIRDPDLPSTTKEKVKKIDSIFIPFYGDETSKEISIQLSIEKCRVTTKDAGNHTDHSCGLFMET